MYLCISSLSSCWPPCLLKVIMFLPIHAKTPKHFRYFSVQIELAGPCMQEGSRGSSYELAIITAFGRDDYQEIG